MPRRARLLAVAVAVLLAAGVVAVESYDDRQDAAARRRPGGATTTTTGTPGATSTSTVPAPLEREVQALQAYVEKARGLGFKHPVKVTLLDDEAFRARLDEAEGEPDDEDTAELRATEKTLFALGLIEEDTDLEQAADKLLDEAVLGFYDHEKDDLVLRGARVTPGVRQVLVHELTHALQDQHFQLERPDLEDRDDEADLAFTALVEGDAVRIDQAYLRSLPREDQIKAEAENSGSDGDYDDVPGVLLQSLAFPYTAGPSFAVELVKAGGQARLDAAFASPPATSEHILHPARFLAGEPAKPVPEPAAESAVVDRGVVGEFGIHLLLEGIVGGLDKVTAATGWGGDRYVTWDTPEGPCLRANFAMDTQRDADQLAKSLRRWAEEVGNADVATGEFVTLTSCA